MKNPLESLPTTVLMGIVLTVIMVGVLAGIADWSEPEPPAAVESGEPGESGESGEAGEQGEADAD